MRDDIASELGGKCEMIASSDACKSGLWQAQVMDGLMKAGIGVSMAQPETGLRSMFHTAEVNVAMQGGEASRPGMQPAPAPEAPALRDVAPKAPGASMG